MFLFDWYTILIYQPFFNLLVGIYHLLAKIDPEDVDMGIAVIIFTIAFRIVWLPISLASGRTLKEKHELTKKITALQEEHKFTPVTQKQLVRQEFYKNKRIIFFSAVNIALQIIIALMLWRIFAKGLAGEDFHLLYDFMPPVTEPFNLTFLGKYDLTHPSLTLNLIQSLSILVYEVVNSLLYVSYSNRRDIIMTQLGLPVVSFIIFAYLPAGKKLFIITTMVFSIGQMLLRAGIEWLNSILNKVDTYTEKQSEKQVNEVAKEVIKTEMNIS